MQNPEPNTTTGYGYKLAQTRVWPKLLAIVVIFVAVGIALLNLPRGYSTDLTVIGKGKPAAVQIFDPNSVSSLDLMQAFNSARGEYEGRIEFLLADLNSDSGKQFAQTHGVGSNTLVLFAADGTKLSTVSGPQDADTLKKLFKQAFRL